MNLLRAHYEKLIAGLAILAVVLSAVFLFLKAASFGELFSAIRGNVAKSGEVGVIDLAPLDEALKRAENPAAWVWSKSSLLVSRKYILKEGQLIDPIQPGGPQLHPPVPNEWFEAAGLDILNPDALTEDPDGDRFDNLNEWENKTDPADKKSHAPYVSKLRLKKFEQVPFRLIFIARPDNDTFQINVVDVRGQPTQYRKVGEKVEGTKFKVVDFAEKFTKNEYGTEIDVSELTLQHEETGEKVVLVKEQTANSPDSYAHFAYLWNGTEKRVKMDALFSLEPETEVEYKLVDINANQAVIENTKTGAKITIPKL